MPDQPHIVMKSLVMVLLGAGIWLGGQNSLAIALDTDGRPTIATFNNRIRQTISVLILVFAGYLIGRFPWW